MNKKTILIIILIFFGTAFANDAQEMLKEIKFDQNIGAQLNPALRFIDENENDVTMQSLFNKKPAVFVFSYSQCKTLCPMVFNGLIQGLRSVKKTVGVDYNVIFLSIDPTDSQKIIYERKKLASDIYQRPTSLPAGWKFLRGVDANIKEAARELGFHYQYDSKLKQYAHPAGLIFLTPTGMVSGYLMGVGYEPSAIEKSLKIASNNKKGNLVTAILLYCFHYDPENSPYGTLIMNSLRIAGVITLLVIGSGFFYLNRSIKRKKA